MLITSLTNNHIKELCKLKEKKYRDLTNTFLVEGEHLIEEAMKENLVEEIISLGEEKEKEGIRYTRVTPMIMKKLSSLDTNPSIMALCKKKSNSTIGNKVLILEDLQDPGNLGTIIRSATAFNIDTILISQKTVDLYNPKVIRATQGMLFHIDIIVCDLMDKIKELKQNDYQIFGTRVDGGKDVRRINTLSKYALIIGNEGHGMSPEIGKLCDEYLYITMNKKTESLNASVAASILLYELSGRE